MSRLASDVTRSEHDPHDRLTALADHMCKVLDVEPDVRAIILLESRRDEPQGRTRAGMMHHGYEPGEEADVIYALLANADALLKTHGSTLREAIEAMGL